MVRQAVLAALCTAAIALGVSGCGRRVVIRTREVEYVPPPPVQPVEVNVSFFHERLAPYGTWSRSPVYGWVWSPVSVPLGWRPYTQGHWVYADDCGWTWVSSWQWGWAPFHYGRWVYDEGYGWLWVPGQEWAPAWVAWRHGGGYVGWAPLPPQVGWNARAGLELRGYDLDRIPWRDWVFVREAHLLSPVHEHVILPQRNVTVLRATRNVTKLVGERGRVAVRSIPPAEIEKAVGGRVTRVKVYDAPSAEAARLPREQENQIRAYRPRVIQAPPSAVPPAREEIDRRHAAESQQLREQLEAERERLERRQDAERKARRDRVEDIRKRHDAEQEALRAEQERRQRLLQQRHQRERERPGQPEPRSAKPEKPTKSDKPDRPTRGERD
jgi:hypothetical protein